MSSKTTKATKVAKSTKKTSTEKETKGKVANTKAPAKIKKSSYERVDISEIPAGDAVKGIFLARVAEDKRNFSIERVYTSLPFLKVTKKTKNQQYKSFVLYHNEDGTWSKIFFILPPADCFQSYTYPFVPGKKPQEVAESGASPTGAQISYPLQNVDCGEFFVELCEHIRNCNYEVGTYCHENPKLKLLLLKVSMSFTQGIDYSVKSACLSTLEELRSEYFALETFFNKETDEKKYMTKYYDPPKKGSKEDTPVSPSKYTDTGKPFNITPTLSTEINWCVSPGTSTAVCFTKFKVTEGNTSKAISGGGRGRLNKEEERAEQSDDEDTEVVTNKATEEEEKSVKNQIRAAMGKSTSSKDPKTTKAAKTTKTTKAAPPKNKLTPKGKKVVEDEGEDEPEEEEEPEESSEEDPDDEENEEEEEEEQEQDDEEGEDDDEEEEEDE